MELMCATEQTSWRATRNMQASMAAISNALLAALPRPVYLKVLARLTPVTLKFGDVLYEPGALIKHAYFPSACLVSLLTLVEGHPALEVGMVGPEGVVGVPLALGAATSPVRALVQGGGPALQISRAHFLAALRDNPLLQRGVSEYVQALMNQVTQTAVCNRFHVVEARLARWLLMTRDRMESGEFRMTHMFMSSMLGVRREGVSEAAHVFQRKALIEYRRGNIVILDHRGLEAAACACYAAGSDAIAPWRPARRR